MIAINRIDEIEKLIFEFKIPAAMKEFASLSEELILASGNLDQSKLGDMLLIIKAMNSALTTKDYLLLSDLLEYELKPFITNSLL